MCLVSSTGKTDSGTREAEPQDRQEGWAAEGPLWNGGLFPFSEVHGSVTSPVKARLLPDWFPIVSLFRCLAGRANSAVLALSPEETVLTSELPYALSCSCAHMCALTRIRLILMSHTVMHSLSHILGFPHPCLFGSLASRVHTPLLVHSCALVWPHSPMTLPSHAFPQPCPPVLLLGLLPHTVPTSHSSTHSPQCDSFSFLAQSSILRVHFLVLLSARPCTHTLLFHKFYLLAIPWWESKVGASVSLPHQPGPVHTGTCYGAPSTEGCEQLLISLFCGNNLELEPHLVTHGKSIRRKMTPVRFSFVFFNNMGLSCPKA